MEQTSPKVTASDVLKDKRATSVIAEELLKNQNAFVIYGSVEKMRKHPLWIDCNQRHQYLVTKIEHIRMAVVAERDATHPANILKRFIINPIAHKACEKFIVKPLQELADRYNNMLNCPIGFVVRGIDEDFDTLIVEHGDAIRAANKTLNIKDDVYV